MLNNELLPHQMEAVEKLRKWKIGALFMEQGTGKTITTLELYRLRAEAGKVEKCLWLCPCNAKSNIKAEIIKQVPDSMLSDFIICGIETLSSSVRANAYLLRLVKEKKCFLCVDESLLIKNPSAKRTDNIIRLAKLCEYKVILNGTPISRNEADLFAQFYMLDWRILGYKSYWSFAANHLEYDERIPGKVVRCLNTEYLSQKIAPYTYQITKEECLTLPEKNHDYYCYSLTQEQMEIYRYVEDKLLMQVDEMKPETIYRLFAGLQAVISGMDVYAETSHLKTWKFFKNPLDNPRIELLMEVLTEEKTIIFAKYTHEIDDIVKVINEEYGDGTAVRFDGTISPKKRKQSLDNFKAEARYFVANRGCAGYSLNLQFCHNIIYYSNDWDLATRLQSEDRVHRYGQENEVRITDLFANHTLDERIYRCVGRKEDLLESFKEEIKKKNSLLNWINCKEEIMDVEGGK